MCFPSKNIKIRVKSFLFKFFYFNFKFLIFTNVWYKNLKHNSNNKFRILFLLNSLNDSLELDFLPNFITIHSCFQPHACKVTSRQFSMDWIDFFWRMFESIFEHDGNSFVNFLSYFLISKIIFSFKS